MEGEVQLIVMNCFGYDLEMKAKVRETTGRLAVLVASPACRPGG